MEIVIYQSYLPNQLKFYILKHFKNYRISQYAKGLIQHDFFLIGENFKSVSFSVIWKGLILNPHVLRSLYRYSNQVSQNVVF